VCVAGYGLASATAARAELPGVAASASQPEVRLGVYRSLCGVRFAARRSDLSVPERAEATRIVSPRFIRHAHAAGFKVQVWTVDEEADMRGCWNGASTD